jgi:hypothetical protein
MSINQYSKEAIKSRIFKIASTFWNIPKADGLDPIIRLLIEAVAEEVYSISKDVDSMETRILEKLANILTPDMLVAPSPAHAILHAHPTETSCVVERDCSLRYENPSFIKKHRLQNMAFSPICRTMLYHGDVRYLVTNGLLYTYDKNMSKQLLARPRTPYMEGNRVWVGLELDKQIRSLKNMSFYIDFPNTPDRNEYLCLLPYTEWRINGSKTDMQNGMYQMEDDAIDESQSPFFKYEISNRIDDNIRKIYANHYMSVACDTQVEKTTRLTISEQLGDLYEDEILQGANQPLLWLSIDFPANFTTYILDDVTVHINTFPIANKFKYKVKTKVEDILGIIPMVTDNNEHFLSVESLQDASNRHYHEVSYKNEDNSNQGTYSIRRGGSERFDSRDARDYLERLTDLLGDESAAFSYKSRGKLLDLVHQMEVLITQMNQLSDTMNEDKEVPYYILIDNLKKKDFFEIEYWVTNCELANNLKAGISLTPYSTALFDPKSIVLLSTTYAGKKEPKSPEKLNMYKYVLTTGDRIVTIHDIISFCRMQLGEFISDVEVRRGVAVSEKPKEGLIRTTDVFISLRPHLKNIAGYDNLCGDIKNKLMEKSPDTYNYRVFINKQ